MLACVSVTVLLPLTSSAAMTTSDVTNAMTALKNSSYPQNYYWCGGNIDSSLSYSGCGSAGCSCNSFNRAYQCQGFALYVAQRIFGSYPAYPLSSYAHGATSGPWKCYTKSALGTQAFCALGLMPGDIVRASYNSSYSSGHTAVVWKVEDGKAYFAEVWGSVYSKINWGGFNYYSYTLEDICSRYSYVALWRNSTIIPSGAHTHNYISESETAHPHRAYRKCLECGESEFTGEYVKLDTCVCCAGIHDNVYTNEAQHPHYEVMTCKLCNNVAYSGATKKDNSCPKCLGIPYNIKIMASSQILSPGEEVTLSFSAENAVSYNGVIKRDGDKTVGEFSTSENSYTFISEDPGNYSITLTAVSSDNKVNSATCDIFEVRVAPTEVIKEENKFIFRYDLALSHEEAELFVSERYLTLIEHAEGYFYAELGFDTLFSEQSGTRLYTYIPCKLSYYEALSFCQQLGAELVCPKNAEENAMLVRLCSASAFGGVLLGANDTASELVWTDSNGKALEYTNWNLAYKAQANRYKNYLYMYPGGTWIDTTQMPSTAYGFVMSVENPFGYTENEDGSLTLTEVPFTRASVIEIPSVYEGKSVTAIGEGAFDGCEIDELVIPESIITVFDTAFDNSVVNTFVISRDSQLEQYFKDKGLVYKYIMPFTDVKKGSWYYDSMFFCYSNRYVSGTSKTKFSPSVSCTREMFVSVLVRLMGADTSEFDGVSSFEDVLPGQWYSEYIEWAYQNGITEGIGDGRFGLGQSITREQIAVLFYNLEEREVSDPDLSAFTDAEDISDWALDGVKWAVDCKLVNGTSATTLEPKRTAMRTELCQLIFNYCNLNI